jgi:hypothetical protein
LQQNLVITTIDLFCRKSIAMLWAKARSYWLTILGLAQYNASKPLSTGFSPLEEMTISTNRILKFSKLTNYAAMLL